MTTAAAKDAWEAHEGRAHGQNDPATGKPFVKPAAPVQTTAPAQTTTPAAPAPPASRKK
jgi:hypothetical protein